MGSNVKGGTQKRRCENRIKRIKKLHLKEIDDICNSHNRWYCENVLLRKEIEQERRDRRSLMFGVVLFVLFVAFVALVSLLNKF